MGKGLLLPLLLFRQRPTGDGAVQKKGGRAKAAGGGDGRTKWGLAGGSGSSLGGGGRGRATPAQTGQEREDEEEEGERGPGLTAVVPAAQHEKLSGVRPPDGRRGERKGSEKGEKGKRYVPKKGLCVVVVSENSTCFFGRLVGRGE